MTAAFDRAAASYDQLGVEFFTPMGKRLVEHAAPREGHRVLDIGCGRGASLFPSAELVGPTGHVLGIDIAPAMVDAARAEAERQGATNVEIRVLDGENPDLPARSFDLVTGSYSVIFIPDAPSAMARYAQLLADHGRIAFTSPLFSDKTFPFLPPIFTELIPMALLSNLPAEWQPEALQRRFNSWLGSVDDLEETMRMAGFQEAVVVDEPVHVVAPSGTAWVDWSHTQGMRLLWQHLTPADSQQLRTRLIAALDDLRDGDGPLFLDVPVRYVTATVARR
ncbi:class I SAM-dependent methyltransferase [Micromonospora sp. LOL_024]|uniref:class I SAM-dependent methyltransferase n=1 Tax=Micromonospora sp. LOL_024 TaxID=3345412 RepID=UPI003A8C73E5